MLNEMDYEFSLKEFQHVYQSLADEQSKYIFKERVLYSLTGDTKHARNVVMMTKEGESFSALLQKKQDIFIFGAGTWGKEMVEVWEGIFSGFLDNDQNKWGTQLEGILICDPKMIITPDFNGKVLISSRLYYKEIYEQLMELGLIESQIINIGLVLDQMAENQYFPTDILTHAKEEVFADVGALDGKSSIRFIKWSKTFKKIYCFEPDQKNVPKCEHTLKPYIQENKAEIIKKGAWSSNTTLFFSSMGNGVSAIAKTGESVQVTSLDSVFSHQEVTFIKMDIEGAEAEALMGCSHTIKEQKPKLAISVYHKAQDIVSLLSIILKLNPDYRLYLRHHSLAAAETVVYAV